MALVMGMGSCRWLAGSHVITGSPRLDSCWRHCCCLMTSHVPLQRCVPRSRFRLEWSTSLTGFGAVSHALSDTEKGEITSPRGPVVGPQAEVLILGARRSLG